MPHTTPVKHHIWSFSTVTNKQLADNWFLRQSHRERHSINSSNGESDNPSRLSRANPEPRHELEGRIALKCIQINVPARESADQMRFSFQYHTQVSLSGNIFER
ncbi:MAG TPA: hypothetical protein VFH91_10665 [Pyrinomonadaceae bacterium]|nr:hypothetical protein [Pyrinomonadaceae bacterium]